jgi:hypothetical protein
MTRKPPPYSVLPGLILALSLIIPLAGLAGIGPEPGEYQIASAAPDDSIDLGDLLDKNGHITVPANFSGSINPSGYKMVTVQGKQPRFVKAGGGPNGPWSEGEFGGPGCDINATDNPVVASIAVINGEVFIGGELEECGVAKVSNIARYDPATNEFTALGDGVNGRVNALATIGTKLYVGGSFTLAGATPAQSLAVFDTTQTGNIGWSALAVGIGRDLADQPGVVYALATIGSDLYVGGQFADVSEQPVDNILKLDTSQSSWEPLGDGVGGLGVRSLAAVGNDLYVGGFFSTAGGISGRNNIARFNTTTSTWSGLGDGVNSFVNAIVAIEDDLYVAGSFTQAGGGVASGIAKFNTNSGWSALGSGLAGAATSLVATGTDLYIGGAFTNAGGLPAGADNIARFDTTGTSSPVWVEVGLGTSSTVLAMAVSGDDLYVGGVFADAGGRGMNGISRFDPAQIFSNEGWSRLGGGLSNTVDAMTAVGTDVYVGGRFDEVGNLPASYIAKFDSTQTGNAGWSVLGDGVNGRVRALTAIGTDLYVGGSFTEVGNGLLANNIARFNTLQTSNAGWSALGSGVNDTVYALTSIGTDLYVGGQFTEAGSVQMLRLARFDTSRSDDLGWSELGAGVNSSGAAVHALTAIGSDLYVGGQFTKAGGLFPEPRNIAKLDTSDDTWSALGDGVDGFGVRALVTIGTDLYVGGGFDNAGGSPASRVARFDTTQTGNAGWSELGGGVDDSVWEMGVIGSDLYVGGDFTEVGGSGFLTANRIAKFRTSQTGNAGWSALGDGANRHVRAIAVGGTDLYIGGDFTEAGGKLNYFFARYEIEDQIFRDRFEQ